MFFMSMIMTMILRAISRPLRIPPLPPGPLQRRPLLEAPPARGHAAALALRVDTGGPWMACTGAELLPRARSVRPTRLALGDPMSPHSR